MGRDAVVRGWWEAGEASFAGVVNGLDDASLEAPSRLATWNRATVVAHVATNAEALCNLLDWAATGVETPMYPSLEARSALIAAAAALPRDELRRRLAEARRRFAERVEQLPEAAWDATVRTRDGREIPASEVLWMRAREVWVHAVDLDAGLDFEDIPEDVLVTLCDDVEAMWSRRGVAPVWALAAGSRRWGAGPVVTEGSLAAVAAVLTGRRPPSSLGAAAAQLDVPAWL